MRELTASELQAVSGAAAEPVNPRAIATPPLAPPLARWNRARMRMEEMTRSLSLLGGLLYLPGHRQQRQLMRGRAHPVAHEHRVCASV